MERQQRLSGNAPYRHFLLCSVVLLCTLQERKPDPSLSGNLQNSAGTILSEAFSENETNGKTEVIQLGIRFMTVLCGVFFFSEENQQSTVATVTTTKQSLIYVSIHLLMYGYIF